MQSQNNIFNNLDEVFDERTTNDLIRKAIKKLREIDILKTKSFLSRAEEEKVAQEKFWKGMLPYKKKLNSKNRYGIGCSYEFHLSEAKECPICLNFIMTNRAIKTNCNHIYCSNCISKIIEKSSKYTPSIRCSLCRGKIEKYDFQYESDMIQVMNLLAYKK